MGPLRFPTATVDVIQRGEALAIFGRDLIIHFQQISKAAALCVRALLVGIQRALEAYCRVDATTNNDPWSKPTPEELWHCHAEGVLMVALNKMNLPQEAWRNAKKAFKVEHDLPFPDGAIGASLLRTIEYRNIIGQELGEPCDADKEKLGVFLLELVDVIYLACNLTQEAGLETVLCAAFSLKHAAELFH